MTFKKSPDADYFGTFLGTMKSGSAGDKTEPEASSQNDALPLATRVRKLLAERSGASMAELASALAEPSVSVAGVVGAMQQAGLVVSQGSPGSEQYFLTENGRKLAAIE